MDGHHRDDSKSERTEGREQRRHGRRHRRRERKERVLHTRVSDALADDIRRMADDLRVPASNLVRNVLEEVFEVVENVTDDVGHLFDDILDEAEAARERVRDQRQRGVHRRSQAHESTRRHARDQALWRAAKVEADEAEIRADSPRRPASPVGPPPLPVDWHIAENGRSIGPFRSEELAAAIRSGRVRSDTPIWCAGMTEWLAAERVDAVRSMFQPPPPPEATPAPPPPKPASGTGDSGGR